MKFFNKINNDESLQEVAKEYGEIAIDSLLEDETLKSIPLLSTIISVANFTSTIQKNIFQKKIEKFLSNLDYIPSHEIQDLIHNIDNSENYESKVAEQLVEILDKVKSEKKPKIIGNFFNAFLKKQISYDDFLRLAHITEIIHIDDIFSLRKSLSHNQKVTFHNDMLLILGLYSTNFVATLQDVYDDIPKQNHSELTDLGKKFIDLGLIGF